MRHSIFFAALCLLVVVRSQDWEEEEEPVKCRDKHVCKHLSNGGFDCEVIDIPDNCTDVTLANHKVGDKGAADIAKYIGMDDKVKKLFLLYAKIGADGAIALAQALKTNTHLESLWIDGNQIGERGGKAIGEALAVNKNLEVLGMSKCGIGAAGGRALSKSLQRNHKIIQLSVGGNDIRPKIEHTIEESVKANKDAYERRQYREWQAAQKAEQLKHTEL